MPPANNRVDTPDAGERLSLVQRLLAAPPNVIAYARRQPLLFVVLFCGTLVISGSAASAAYYLLTRGPASDRHVTIEAALKLLDANKLDEAEDMAHRLRRKLGGDYRHLGYPLFVLGSVLSQQAEQLGHADERRIVHLVAARYLEEARNRGLPPGREKEGLYRLAISLFNGGHFAESLPVLREAYEQMPHQKHELARRLSIAYLRDEQPDLHQALHYNQIWLADPSLTGQARDEALLAQAEIALRQGDLALCHDSLAQIDDSSAFAAQAYILRGRLAIREGDQLIADSGDTGADTDAAKEKYRQAIGLLGQAQSKDDLVGSSIPQTQYLLGVCHQKLGDFLAATRAFERTARGHYGTPEALAAALAEAEIALQEGHADIALKLFKDVVHGAGPPDFYENRWVPLDQLRGRLCLDLQKLVDIHEYPVALELANELDSLVPADEVAAAKAETHEAWAEYLLADADQMNNHSAQAKRAEARHQFRLAAEQYQQLARLRFATPEYPTDLWKSGSCFVRGQNYVLGARLLREHLENIPRKQAAAGLVSLGECHLALGHYNTAIGVLNECIQFFPKHPESYRARILASIAYREKEKGDDPQASAFENLHKAQALLIDNLHKSSLTPRSRYWQQSLRDYGTLLYQEGLAWEREARRLIKEADQTGTTLDQRQAGLAELKKSHDLFQESIATLGESVQRQKKMASEQRTATESSEAKYFIAQAYRHSANLPKRSLEIEPTQTRRNALRQQIRKYMRQAEVAYRELQEQLARQQNNSELSVVGQRILRNTYFAYADTLFDLEEYDQAITAYVAATNRYQHQPEALEALMQIATCYRRLGSTAEARGTIQQAKSVLSRIPEDANFIRTTRYDREQWEELIDWLAAL
jgi:TolA-binding protein